MALPAPWLWTSGLQTMRHEICCQPPCFGTSLWQPRGSHERPEPTETLTSGVELRVVKMSPSPRAHPAAGYGGAFGAGGAAWSCDKHPEWLAANTSRNCQRRVWLHGELAESAGRPPEERHWGEGERGRGREGGGSGGEQLEHRQRSQQPGEAH